MKRDKLDLAFKIFSLQPAGRFGLFFSAFTKDTESGNGQHLYLA